MCWLVDQSKWLTRDGDRGAEKLTEDVKIPTRYVVNTITTIKMQDLKLKMASQGTRIFPCGGDLFFKDVNVFAVKKHVAVFKVLLQR